MSTLQNDLCQRLEESCTAEELAANTMTDLAFGEGFSIDELVKWERAQGRRIASRLIQKYGSHDRLEAVLGLTEEHEMGREWLWALGELWTGFDYLGVNRDYLLQEVFERADNVASLVRELMSEEEYAAFEALPEILTIYRGCGPENVNGFSWSLDRDIAAKFPYLVRYRSSCPILLTATIPKSRAAALKLERNEQEIIVFDDADEPSVLWTAEPIDAKPLTVS